MRRRVLAVAVCVLVVAVYYSVQLYSFLFDRSWNKSGQDKIAFAVSPNGESVVFSSAEGDLFLLDISTQRVRRLFDTPLIERQPAFSPDGSAVVYAAGNKGEISSHLFIRSLEGQQIQQLTNDHDVWDALPRYSSDGSRIVFARAHRHRPYSMGGWTWDDWDVCAMDARGGKVRRITKRKHNGINSVLFSVDGKTIFYSAESNRDSGHPVVTLFQVSTIGAAGSAPVAPMPKSADYYSWASDVTLSPDGQQFAFVSDRNAPFHYDIFLMNVADHETRPINATRISQYNQSPAISPTGREVFFLAGREWDASSRPVFSLWCIGADGRNPRCIAPSSLLASSTTDGVEDHNK
jgi:Tol biopolymer transport system component